MNKSEAYIKLFNLSDAGIDISEPISELAVSQSVSENVQKFIRENSCNTKNIDFIKTLKNKKFYKTIQNSDSIIDEAKGISSFITHVLIELDNHPDNIDSISNSIDFNLLLDGLKNYLINKDDSKIKESIDYLKSIFEKEE